MPPIYGGAKCETQRPTPTYGGSGQKNHHIWGAPRQTLNKYLLPINQPHFEIVGIEWKALTKQIEAAIETIQQAIAASG